MPSAPERPEVKAGTGWSPSSLRKPLSVSHTHQAACESCLSVSWSQVEEVHDKRAAPPGG